MKEFYASLLVLVCVSCGPMAETSSSLYNGDRMVNTGYEYFPAESLTSTVSVIEGDDIVPYRDIYEMIQGKCAGVQVTGRSITIRGKNYINLSTEPLFVVDGVAVEDVSHINPREVKNITVLKDSAASIYGVRGANGVILITLK